MSKPTHLTADDLAARERWFWPKVRGGDVETCWEWTAATCGRGYAHFALGGGRTTKGHRFAYALLIGDVPDDLKLDHLCRNIICVNPWHLEPVPQQVNILRGESVAARNREVTACPSGHPYTPENTRNYRGRRYCWTCHRLRARQRRAWPRTHESAPQPEG